MAQLESNLRGGFAGRGQCRHQVTYLIVDRLLAVDGGRDLRANEVAISTWRPPVTAKHTIIGDDRDHATLRKVLRLSRELCD
jgi:hypothetical protein